MAYKPRRDYRFEYIWDAIAWVEDNQCRSCIHRKSEQSHSFNDEYPMCHEVEADFVEEKPVQAVEDLGDEGLLCTRYQMG